MFGERQRQVKRFFEVEISIYFRFQSSFLSVMKLAFKKPSFINDITDKQVITPERKEDLIITYSTISIYPTHPHFIFIGLESSGTNRANIEIGFIFFLLFFIYTTE